MCNKIIVMYEDIDKQLNMSVYNCIGIQHWNSDSLLICHVTDEEYQIMLDQIKYEGSLYERMLRIVKPDIGYDKFRYMAAYSPRDCRLYLANYEDSKQKGSYFVDENGITFDKDLPPFPENRNILAGISMIPKIYTTETYQNMLDYYKEKTL